VRRRITRGRQLWAKGREGDRETFISEAEKGRLKNSSGVLTPIRSTSVETRRLLHRTKPRGGGNEDSIQKARSPSGS